MYKGDLVILVKNQTLEVKIHGFLPGGLGSITAVETLIFATLFGRANNRRMVQHCARDSSEQQSSRIEFII